jgi:serine/threonine protein kinase
MNQRIDNNQSPGSAPERWTAGGMSAGQLPPTALGSPATIDNQGNSLSNTGGEQTGGAMATDSERSYTLSAGDHDADWLAEEAALLAQNDAQAIEAIDAPEIRNPIDFVMASSRPVVINLKKNFRVLAHRPLPLFDSPSAKAFEALHVRDRERKYYALVSDTQIPPRVNMVLGLRNSGVNGLVCPQDWGVIEWIGGKPCYTIIMEQPGIKRLVRDLADTFVPISDKMVSRSLLAPAYTMLSELASRGYTHRALRLTNMFLNDGAEASVVFGECYSKVPGFDQPAVFEPIESALCHPIARGEGGISDDIYALGVCLGILLCGYNPFNGLSAQQIIDRKMTMGSFNALMGHARVSPMMMEPLRGMLADSHKNRWGLRDLDNWLNGRQSSPHTAVSRPKAARAFKFLGEPYYSLPHLAIALGRYWTQGVEEVLKKPMGIWLKRSSNDEEKSESFEKLIAQAPMEDAVANDIVLSRACNIFYPEGPIFFRGVNFLPDGFKNILFLCLQDSSFYPIVHDVIERRLLSYWLNRQSSLPLQYINTMESVATWKKFLNTHGLGFGLERCLYEANPGMLCLSPLVFQHTVTDLVSLLQTMDELAVSQPDFSKVILDAHLAGFILAGLRNTGLGFAKMINLEDDAQKRLGWLGLLSLIQQKRRMGPLPNLAAAIYPWLTPILQLFHSHSRQNRIKEELEKAVKNGSLTGMMAILQNYVDILNDKNGFYRARYEYHALKIKNEEINLSNKKKLESNIPIGQQIVAFVAGATAAVFMLVVMYREYGWEFFL